MNESNRIQSNGKWNGTNMNGTEIELSVHYYDFYNLFIFSEILQSLLSMVPLPLIEYLNARTLCYFLYYLSTRPNSYHPATMESTSVLVDYQETAELSPVEKASLKKPSLSVVYQAMVQCTCTIIHNALL